MVLPAVDFPMLFVVVRIIGTLVTALVLIWTVHFRGGLALVSDNKDLIFNLVGGWAALKFHNEKGIDNLYSLHSWLGLGCLLLFAFQWAAGFVTFWYPGGGSGKIRSTLLLPWHVFFGVYVYVLAVCTCITGILEKATFLQSSKVISRYSNEAILLNSLGVLIFVLGWGLCHSGCSSSSTCRH